MTMSCHLAISLHLFEDSPTRDEDPKYFEVCDWGLSAARSPAVRICKEVRSQEQAHRVTGAPREGKSNRQDGEVR
jgi:hypothetical protein